MATRAKQIIFRI